ncbi:MAG TPA: cupredoxin family copper-binding protein [Thermodesulfobacteriota bacterium]|jgi:plastocyanin|nr:cupredoxin family copper-binding protein [Thermodesulfobacteriota bacterium]
MKKSNLTVWAAAAFVAAVLSLTTTWTALADEPQSKVHVVEIRNLEFIPAELQVLPGDTVEWVNKDFIPHTATANDESWDSGLLNKDDSWKLTVTSDTQTNYFCRFHPNMKGQFVLTIKKEHKKR